MIEVTLSNVLMNHSITSVIPSGKVLMLQYPNETRFNIFIEDMQQKTLLKALTENEISKTEISETTIRYQKMRYQKMYAICEIFNIEYNTRFVQVK